MVFEDLLWLILSAIIVRAVWRLVDGATQRLSERSSQRSQQNPHGEAPARGVQMVRDPVCGTYVVPDRAVVTRDGSRVMYFCSVNCRDKYSARTA